MKGEKSKKEKTLLWWYIYYIALNIDDIPVECT